jgi:hypothetical protein
MMIIISEHKKLLDTGKDNLHSDKPAEKVPERPAERRSSSPAAVANNLAVEKPPERHSSFAVPSTSFQHGQEKTAAVQQASSLPEKLKLERTPSVSSTEEQQEGTRDKMQKEGLLSVRKDNMVGWRDVWAILSGSSFSWFLGKKVSPPHLLRLLDFICAPMRI